MYEVLKTAIIDFGIYGALVLIYTIIGSYQNINIWGESFDWKKYVNGLVKYLSFGAAAIATTVAAYALLTQAEAQGVALTNVQALAPKAIFAVTLLASAGVLVKIISKLSTKLGLTDQQLEEIQQKALDTDPDKFFTLDIDNIPTPVRDYVENKVAAENDPNTGLGAMYSVPIDNYDHFRNTVNGNGYDIDGYYGFQCWDGTALLWQQLGLPLITGNGLAIGCWDLKRDVNKYDKFDLVTDVNSLQRGDVVCMRPNHIGFFDGYDGNYMIILGQNQGGIPYVNGGSKFNLTRVAKSAFAGAFRYHGWTVKPVTPPTPTPTPTPPTNTGDSAGFAVGDIVVPTSLVDYNGTPLTQYDETYTITELNGDRAVLSARGAVWAAMNVKNIKKVGTATTPIAVGDTVVPTTLVDYDGTTLVQYDDTYTVSELSGDRAVLMARGAVWAAMNVANIRKV